MVNEIFNFDKTDYKEPKLLMGELPGLFDTVNKKFPEIWGLYKLQKSLDWDENEFNYSTCNVEFKSCPKSVYEMMIKTLAWQWEADSVASRAIITLLAPFITSSELWAAWSRVSDNENVHAATYSEIVRNSFDNPDDILDEILSVEEAHSRLGVIAKIFAEGSKTSKKYSLGLVENNQDTYEHAIMLIAALYCLERIQFMASFAVTFAICDSGYFQPIGKAVQKIAQDELEVHVELDKAVLSREFQTDRGKIALQNKIDLIESMIDEIVETEFAWIDYLFSEGRELVGLTPDHLKKWTLYCAKDVYNFFGIKSEKYKFPKEIPLKYMEKWLDISKTQPAPQEQDIAAYKVGVMRRTDEDVVFDIDF